MQEEVEQKVVILIKSCTKLTADELRKAMTKALNQVAHKAKAPPRGKMTVKQLAAQNKGLQSIEVTDKNIGSFNRVARKYGIDFAPFKVKGEDKYIVFFKAPDTDAMTAAFKEYTARELNKSKRPSVLKHLEQLQALMKNTVREHTKHKEIER